MGTARGKTTYTVSKDSCSSYVYAYCDEEVEDVTQCTAWKIRSSRNTFESVTVTMNANCDSAYAMKIEDDVYDGDKKEEYIKVVIAVILIIIVIFATFGALYWCYRRRKNNEMQNVESVQDEEIEEEEISMEVTNNGDTERL